MKKHIPYIAFIIGFGILSFIFLVVLLTAISFLIGDKVTPILAIVSLLLSSGLVYYLLSKQAVPKPLLWVLVFVTMILGSVAFSSVTIDPSYDGNSYHKTAIGLLANGWNPVQQDVNIFNSSDDNPFKLNGWNGLDRGYDTPWLNHYPKASWFFAANIYRLTGNIESGKALTPLVIIALLLFAFSYLSKKLSRNKALLLSFVLAFNPIIVTQLYGYLNDGVLGNLLIILLIVSTMLIDKKVRVSEQQWLLCGTIFITIVLAMNIKFTGLPYAGIITVCYWVYLIIARRWQTVIKLTTTGLAAVIFGVLVVGASSYVKNTYTNGNPFYPLAGKDRIDFMPMSQPMSYAHKSGIRKFVESNLSPTGQGGDQDLPFFGDPPAKIPFTISMDELSMLAEHDNRQGGYGVWFGGILLISSVAGIYLLIKHGRRTYRQYLPLYLLPLASVAITVLAFDTTWWARYLPHLYIFPIIVVVALYLLRKTALPNLLIFALLFNTTLTASVGLSAQADFRQMVKKNIAQNVSCDNKLPTRIYSAHRLDGALYNVWDACHKLRAITPKEFDSIPQTSRIELFKGVYVIRKT